MSRRVETITQFEVLDLMAKSRQLQPWLKTMLWLCRETTCPMCGTEVHNGGRYVVFMYDITITYQGKKDPLFRCTGPKVNTEEIVSCPHCQQCALPEVPIFHDNVPSCMAEIDKITTRHKTNNPDLHRHSYLICMMPEENHTRGIMINVRREGPLRFHA